jgi:hypothetical protein
MTDELRQGYGAVMRLRSVARRDTTYIQNYHRNLQGRAYEVWRLVEERLADGVARIVAETAVRLRRRLGERTTGCNHLPSIQLSGDARHATNAASRFVFFTRGSTDDGRKFEKI